MDKKADKKSYEVAPDGEKSKSLPKENLVVEKEESGGAQPKKVLAKRSAPKKKERSKKKITVESSEELADKPQKGEGLLNADETHDDPK